MPYEKKPSYRKFSGKGKGSNREPLTLNREPVKYKPKRGKLVPLMFEEEKETANSQLSILAKTTNKFRPTLPLREGLRT